jgi:hypothetical protein
MNTPTICLVYCYFGPIPWYFKYFIHSCRYNPSVDFLLFMDAETTCSLPANVKTIKATINSIKQLIDTRLNIKTTFVDAYKLCDFKPAYGDIFSEYLSKYNFWGHGDLDLIFGDIRNFFTDKVLNDHDVLCVRKEYVTGFLTLFKNVESVTKLYSASADYKRIFEDSQHYCFDECGRTFYELMCGISIFETNCAIESMTHVVKKFQQEGRINVYFEMSCVEDLPGKIEWRNGKLFFTKTLDQKSTRIDWNNGSQHNERKEVILYHLIKFKKLRYYYVPQWDIIPKNVFINKESFSKFHFNSLFGRLSNFVLDRFSAIAVDLGFLSTWLRARFRLVDFTAQITSYVYTLEDTDNEEFLKIEFTPVGLFCQLGDEQLVGRKSKCYPTKAGHYISFFYKIELEFTAANEIICREPSRISPAWEQKFLLSSSVIN